jgi:predicted RNA-binding protein YlxR (DUF448 family)
MKKQRHKHIPKRTCVACRQKMDKRILTRIVHTADEGVIVDITGKREGRGAYLCQNPDCWDKALQSDILDRALKTELSKVQKEALLAFRLEVTPSLDS